MFTSEPLTLIVPIPNCVEQIGPHLRSWTKYLETEIGREFDFLVVDDGSTDGTAQALVELQRELPRLRVLRHETPRGFGACLRTALGQPTHPIVGYCSLGSPYQMQDCRKLLEKLGESVEIFGVNRTVEAVSGCRTGGEVPAFWRFVGTCYRSFCRVVLGTMPAPFPGWLSFRDHSRSWLLSLAMSVPLMDVSSRFKVFRRTIFDRFPIQSDGEFVHAEIFAKLTHLTVIINEVPLIPNRYEESEFPRPDPIPEAPVGPRSWWQDFWLVFKEAQFHTTLPDRSQPPIATA
jgi:glycosyltransferase involved in cell wall biosynthesis